MTVKKAIKLIKKYTAEIMESRNDLKIDKIERKIGILRDFINFKNELRGL